MIEFKNVSYTYTNTSSENTVAVNNVSFRVNDGEFWGIIGHTGSGKSTVTELMAGLLKTTEGTVLVDGIDIKNTKNVTRALKGKVGVVFQYPEHQLFEETVIRDVAFGPGNLGYSESESLNMAREAMALVGLDESFEEKSPFELSGGEKRRVAIAGVLAMRPEVIVLDEPTAGLDPKGRDLLLDVLGDIKGKRCKSVVLVSHSMEDVARCADKVLVMNQGRVELIGDVREVFGKSAQLTDAGLDIPQVARLVERLKDMGHSFDGSILTVEEAADAIYNKLKGMK